MLTANREIQIIENVNIYIQQLVMREDIQIFPTQ